MNLKKFISLMLAAVLICLAPVTQTASAETYSIVSPLYEMADSASSDLSVNGTRALCTSKVLNSTAVKITAEQYLQKQGFLWIWGTYSGAHWTKTVNDNTIYMSNTKTGLSSGKYRVKTVFKLTDKNGKTETITVNSDTRSV